MTRPRIGILFGGVSDEHAVSLKSAAEVAAHLDRDRWDPVFVGITRTGGWRLGDGPVAGWEDGAPVTLSPDREVHGLVRPGGEVTRLDAVFPVLHGAGGEDGAIQGLLELAGIPYVGCGVPASALAIDKSLAYLAVAAAGIPTPGFAILEPGDPLPEELAYPVFVKPARSGSSFGVTKVDDADGMPAALAEARRFDDKVLVEQAVRGLEVGCAVLGSGRDLVTGEVDQITLSHGLFRIHQESAPEQGSENSTVTVPADLPGATRDRIRETARTIYRALGCRGLARVDMFLTPEGAIVLNEVNTMPGFTSYSRYPRMMAAAGIGMTELLDRLLDAALASRAAA